MDGWLNGLNACVRAWYVKLEWWIGYLIREGGLERVAAGA